jgi:proteasome lid subunit RPN8/RPN11
MTYDPMPEFVARKLVDEARIAFPREACGIVFQGFFLKGLKNVHPEPANNFAFSQQDLLGVFRENFDEIIGVFHTHPRGQKTPSQADCEFAYPKLRYWIATRDDVYEWTFDNGEPIPIEPGTGERGPRGLAYPILARSVQVRPSLGDQFG